MNKRLILPILSLLASFIVYSRDIPDSTAIQRFYYQNGVLSSEGCMRNGQPDGYWKSYYETGILKSEGNRRDFQLDSLWKFYSQEGRLMLEITYREGKRNGIKTSWIDRETIRERYINDVKEGYTDYYHIDGWKKKDIPFANGMEQGIGREYAPDGTVITITAYRKGFIVERIKINRTDASNRKQGKWITFWDNGAFKTEGTYSNDLKHGYFRSYTSNGDLLSIEKYYEGTLIPQAEEIQKLQVEKEYYPDGSVKARKLYRNGIPEGISIWFSPEGNIERAIEYHQGQKTGEGLVLEDGSRDGPWKEYYPEGSLRAEGLYRQGVKTGTWKYYHQNGTMEQTGAYNHEGKPDGTWKWYFDSGEILREEHYYRGKREGIYEEFDEAGNLIARGDFYEGLEDGPWFRKIGDFYERGSYRDGLRSDTWYQYTLNQSETRMDSLLMFRGAFIEDLPDGRHVYYWDNGNVRDEGTYLMGKKEGDWIKYNYDGTIFMIITYVNGTETRYDGVKLKPPFEIEE